MKNIYVTDAGVLASYSAGDQKEEVLLMKYFREF